MKRVPISVKSDYIAALSASVRPVRSISELIWNGLDADATRIEVELIENALDDIDEIHVRDNGHGIPFERVDALFGNLGGSWKADQRKTEGGRGFHGKSGKGRFQSFALGGQVEWQTQSKHNGSAVRYVIKGVSDNLESFEISDPNPVAEGTTGTEVVIYNLRKSFNFLSSENAYNAITQLFAPYLTEYPGIKIIYHGRVVDPQGVQERVTEQTLSAVLSSGDSIPLKLTIIEWTHSVERSLYLCDAAGIALHEVSPGVHAPGFSFTGYLKSDYIRDLDLEGSLVLDELHPDVATLIEVAKDKLREYFRVRAVEKAAGLVQEWKDNNIYPYYGDPKDQLEEAERQVFDVVAINISSYLSDFEKTNVSSKRFTFELVKQAIKENPESLQRVFQEVLKLPKERQDDLAELLRKTSLSSIITSAKIISSRLDFIKALEILLFDPESKEKLLERDQLHHILAKETWIFGENFHLTHSEDSLNEVLEKYRNKLDKPYDDDSPVTLEDGGTGRIDLMLARTVPYPRSEEREHLIVELKRPKKRIDSGVLSQIEGYAIAVAKDERFRDTKTKWVFWTVSNEMTEEARRKSNQRGRPDGLVFDDAELQITVWSKTWGQIINECKARLNFFKEKLSYEADKESAKDYLRKTHEKYIPKCTGFEKASDT